MSDETNGTTPSNDELLKMIANLQQQQPPAAAAAANTGGWGTKVTAIEVNPVGVSVPMKIETDQGSLRVMVNLGPEAITGPEALMAAIEGLERKGFPLDFWKKKGNSWGNNGGNGGYNKGGGRY